ncbi:hypothetical protein TWF594_009323 [Orbilia oligospora]|uniref:Uncharacterized protein n=1 Tax=Orbilia oligospora TaxID=2813651 RepID=A0A7C8JTL5_ORBOL|nr:hypothetical protein TWF594_009323 [Orbilia oligospora]KAF3138484.1 hypothetical protein TWF703_004531 [Orbilia oligospora]
MTTNAVLFWRPTPAAPDPTPEPEAQEEEGGVRLDQNEDEEEEEEGGIRLAEEGGQAADPRIDPSVRGEINVGELPEEFRARLDELNRRIVQMLEQTELTRLERMRALIARAAAREGGE